MDMLKTVAVIAGILVGVNAMSQTTSQSSPKETITLGGGCFWCTEAVFEQLKGVEKVESGYSGGTVANPTYEEVSSGETGHAEVSQITFDPKVISAEGHFGGVFHGAQSDDIEPAGERCRARSIGR